MEPNSRSVGVVVPSQTVSSTSETMKTMWRTTTTSGSRTGGGSFGPSGGGGVKGETDRSLGYLLSLYSGQRHTGPQWCDGLIDFGVDASRVSSRVRVVNPSEPYRQAGPKLDSVKLNSTCMIRDDIGPTFVQY